MHINLARKWRSKHFDELVGQPLVVRLVKNSLYRNLIFPVYLLSGTRGCGKTSIARLFAAALNCEALEQFQKNPQSQQMPCLACASCKAMQAMNHPDFIEIDAASHTGVDNVRQIIDAASFVPVLGTKKIYLIDEAHMLSKAAFNALLKILEEPPQSVVFMLATTDPHKILETVTSRCFQLFFDPIKPDAVVDHLASLCQQEGLIAEREALMLVAQETGGSMRDALNLVERLRIAYPEITKKAVIELLASIDDERLCELFEVIIQGSPEEMLATCARLELHTFNAQVVWKKLVELIRLSLWIKHGVKPREGSGLHARLKELVVGCSYERLISLFELCYSFELSFPKTSVPSSMLEMMLLKMTQPTQSGQQGQLKANPGTMSAARSTTPQLRSAVPVPASGESSRGVSAAGSLQSNETSSRPVAAQPSKPASTKPSPGEPVLSQVVLSESAATTLTSSKGAASSSSLATNQLTKDRSAVDAVPVAVTPDAREQRAATLELNNRAPGAPDMTEQESALVQKQAAVVTPVQKELSPWGHCLIEIEKMNDPLVVSIFKQGMHETYDPEKKILALTFPQDLAFFKDWLENTKKIWQPLIERFFGDGSVLALQFTGVSTKERPVKMSPIAPVKAHALDGVALSSSAGPAPTVQYATVQYATVQSATAQPSTVQQSAAAQRTQASVSKPSAPQQTKNYSKSYSGSGRGTPPPKSPEAPLGKQFIPEESTAPLASMAVKLFPGTLTATPLKENL